MIQDIQPNVFTNAYLPQPPDCDSYALYFSGGDVLAAGGADGALRLPCFRDFSQGEPLEWTYLFSVNDRRFYLLDAAPAGLPADFCLQSIRLFRTAQPQYLAFAGVTGFQLYNWYRSHRFCGRCGQPLRKDEKERMLFCDACRNMEYPRISPAIIVGVTHGNRLLLSKYANREYKRYALLAGFAEIGETIEETVRREVMEEVGLRVKNLCYYKSQPWSFSDTLLLGFFAELDGDDETIRLDKEELALAEWFDRKRIPPVESLISLTNEMIETFRAGGWTGR